jgi:hypothetical protein
MLLFAVDVAVMVAFPAFTAVITPFETVATEVLLLVQVMAVS